MKKIKILAFALILLFTMCKATKDKSEAMNPEPLDQIEREEPEGGRPQHTAPAIVYKTRADYSRFVPITLNSQRSAIQSYPAPTDVYYDGEFALPIELADGYLLDNRGISSQTAFLNITYEEYSKLVDINLDFLWQNIQDATPLLELYNCGSRNDFTNEVEELNLIIQNRFKDCKRITIPPSAVLMDF